MLWWMCIRKNKIRNEKFNNKVVVVLIEDKMHMMRLRWFVVVRRKLIEVFMEGGNKSLAKEEEYKQKLGGRFLGVIWVIRALPKIRL